MSTICIINNPEYHKRTKHIDIRYHFIRERVENNTISVQHIRSDQQRADILTKSLPKNHFELLRKNLGLRLHIGKHSNDGSVEV